jgi:Protein of unknown function (DUF2955)
MRTKTQQIERGSFCKEALSANGRSRVCSEKLQKRSHRFCTRLAVKGRTVYNHETIPTKFRLIDQGGPPALSTSLAVRISGPAGCAMPPLSRLKRLLPVCSFCLSGRVRVGPDLQPRHEPWVENRRSTAIEQASETRPQPDVQRWCKDVDHRLLRYCPLSGVLLIDLCLFLAFRYGLRGGNNPVATFLVVGLTMISAADTAEFRLAVMVIGALVKGLLVACRFSPSVSGCFLNPSARTLIPPLQCARGFLSRLTCMPA